jgi:large subunit ribosomal protein L18
MKSLKIKRQKRVRAKLAKTRGKLRLSVFRSNKFISAQIIDDEKKTTLVAVSEKELAEKGIKTEKAKKLGAMLAKKAIDKKIKEVIFDRGQYAYHGRVKAFAEGAREGGLVF